MSYLEQYSLEDIMHLPLPKLTYQKKLMYRPVYQDVLHVYELLNESVFRNQLEVPEIIIKPYRKRYWGMCVGSWDVHPSGSYCSIELMDKFYCPQWLVTILAHEMAHQHQWDIETKIRKKHGKSGLMSHGPTFFRFKEKLYKHGIPLKTYHNIKKWFKYQDMFKC